MNNKQMFTTFLKARGIITVPLAIRTAGNFNEGDLLKLTVEKVNVEKEK